MVVDCHSRTRNDATSRWTSLSLRIEAFPGDADEVDARMGPRRVYDLPLDDVAFPSRQFQTHFANERRFELDRGVPCSSTRRISPSTSRAPRQSSS